METYPEVSPSGQSICDDGVGVITVSPSGRLSILEAFTDRFDDLLRSGARRLAAHQRRLFMAEGAIELGDGSIEKGPPPEGLPSERTLREILNRMNDRRKRIQKGKPLKKTKETEAIVANLKEVHPQARDDPQTLEISMDTKAKVGRGDYARGGEKPGPMPRVK
jgi:hypothetical protein